jgi:hydrogenase maturation factor HypF (carbamoyltransferase family)
MKKDEWKKCELLCKKCHRKYSNAENRVMRRYWLENVSLDERRKLINEHLQNESL